MIGFASKVMGHLRFGFAAGCETVALPRRRGTFQNLGLCPGCGLWPSRSEGPSPNQGHSPGTI